MNDRACRIATMLAVGPLAVGFIAVMGHPTLFGNVENAGQIFIGMATFGAVAATFVLWWRFVSWNVRRVLLTLLMTALLTLHLIVFSPIWDVGCMKEFLLTNQSLGVFGLWRLACPLIWWGVFVFVRREQRRRIGGRRAMTATAVRLLVGMSLIPILPALFFIGWVGLNDHFGLDDELAGAITIATCILVAVCLWIAIWRKAVRWTRFRVWGTAILAAAMLPSAVSPYYSSANDAYETIVMNSPLLVWGMWFIGTAWLWRERGESDAAESTGLAAASPTCPSCQYSLRGLAEAKCPECGWSGTLDAVFEASIPVADV
ncbi:MAG: hypothetical protein KDA33_17230 [Phycisphaerales bacterium]|nr:hypothetical protein [Phycisphaerales bacterium]